MLRWVQIVLRDAAGVKTYPNVTRYYWKGRELCLELTERAPDGNPLIMGHPAVQIACTIRPRVPEPDEQLRWVEIILRDEMQATPMLVVGYEWKGPELLLATRNEEGEPVTRGYPEGRIFSTARSHLPHAGMEERKEEPEHTRDRLRELLARVGSLASQHSRGRCCAYCEKVLAMLKNEGIPVKEE